VRVGGQAQTRVSAYALSRDADGRELLVRGWAVPMFRCAWFMFDGRRSLPLADLFQGGLDLVVAG
jgi:hypothetical protein